MDGKHRVRSVVANPFMIRGGRCASESSGLRPSETSWSSLRIISFPDSACAHSFVGVQRPPRDA